MASAGDDEEGHCGIKAKTHSLSARVRAGDHDMFYGGNGGTNGGGIHIGGWPFIVTWFLHKENAVTLRRNSPSSVIIGINAKTRMNDLQ